jgi:predicted enzyme related to lactoylglutathione lyase
MKLYFSLFCNDIQAQLAYYLTLLDLPEAVARRSPIYRSIQGPSFEFGFHAAPAYALLGVADRAPATLQTSPVTAYATFMLSSCAEVDILSRQAAAMGGRIIKAPYPTYYGQWQAVLADPENNMFRLSFQGLPEGVMAPTLSF